MLKTQNIGIRQKLLGPNHGALEVPKVEGGERYWAHPVAKQLLGATSHVSRGQLFPGPPDFGESPLTHTHRKYDCSAFSGLPPPLPAPTPPHLPTQGTSESGSLTETWAAPSGASALSAAQLLGCSLGIRSRRPSWADLHPGILCFLPRFSPQRLHTPLLCVMWSHSLSQRFHSIRIWDGGRCPLPTSSQVGAATVPWMPAKTQNAWIRSKG